MKKIIALSSVLALGALGMACGEAAPANNSTNKPANAPAANAPAANAPAANAPAANAPKTAAPAANAPAANAPAANVKK